MRLLSQCPLCRSAALLPHVSAKDYTVTRDTFDVVICTKCAFCFTNPQPNPEDLDRFYASEEYISHSETKKGIINRLYHAVQRVNLRSKYKICKNNAPNGRWADYGSGAGAFAKYVQDRGVQIYGFEPNESARKASASKGLTSKHTDEFPNDQSYTCITLWHVLEHIPDFVDQLREITRSLDTKGILVLALPNHLSYDAIKYEAHWAAYDLPRHLWHFTADDVKLLAEQLELVLESTHPMYFDSFYVSMLSEKYKGSNQIHGVWRGLVSNLLAMLGRKPYSSQIYILRK